MAALASTGAGAQPRFQVPPGFTIKQVSGPPAISFPMFGALDDRGRLYVTESSGNDLYAELEALVRKCRVSQLSDLDGDGRYEVAKVFAENLTPSMGLVWRGGKLYVADPPDLVTLEDTDGDGRADKRTVILTGFGHTDNGSLHGLTFGPDGLLYFTTGNPDGYDLRGPDGSHTRGGVGALLRCRPDGSRVETVARGFENLVEVVFLPDASIIGTVTWYQLPEGGIRDALVQLLEEAQFPIHPVDTTVPHLQFNAVLPAVALFPAVAHSGLEIYQGTAFPPEMQGCLFSAQHNSRKIVRHRLTPKGASYSCETLDFVTTEDPDVHFSDVLEDRDGSLLLLDTGSWYVQHCPTGRIRQAPARGGIYRVWYDRPSLGRPAEVAVSTNWLIQLNSTKATAVAAAARMIGRQSDSNAMPALLRLTNSRDAGVRLAAAEALAHCGNASAVPGILESLKGEKDPFLQHALTYALFRLGTTRSLSNALHYESPEVQRAALLLLDQAPFQSVSPEEVIPRLNVEDGALRDTARWVLSRHQEWGQAGAAFLRHLLEIQSPTEADDHALAQFLPLFVTNEVVATTIAHALDNKNPGVNDERRARLLDALAGLDLKAKPARWFAAVVDSLQSTNNSVVLAAVRTSSALRIAGAEAGLSELVRTPGKKTDVRLAALRELVRVQAALDSERFSFLLGCLAENEPPAVRLAVAEILTSAKLTCEQLVPLLKAVRTDPIISPGSILVSVERNGLHPECAIELLNYLASRVDAGWTFPSEPIAKLQDWLPETQRAQVAGIMARLAQSTQRQREQLGEYAPLLSGGDSLRGEKLFFEKAQCVTCHRLWENGGRVGPDLSRVGAIRSGRDILESLLVPSATIAQGYDTLDVTTKDGESYSGVRVGTGNNPLHLRLASGADVLLHQGQIETITRSKISLMPEGLLNALSRDEVRDLLAFLQHLK